MDAFLGFSREATFLNQAWTSNFFISDRIRSVTTDNGSFLELADLEDGMAGEGVSQLLEEE